MKWVKDVGVRSLVRLAFDVANASNLIRWWWTSLMVWSRLLRVCFSQACLQWFKVFCGFIICVARFVFGVSYIEYLCILCFVFF